MWLCAPIIEWVFWFMSNQWMQPDDEYEEDEEQAQQQLPKGFRTQLNKVTKENRELREANDKLLKQVRETAISQVLSTKGVDAKVAKLVPADIEPTAEAVEKWLADWGDVFTPKSSEGKGSQEAGEENSTGEGEGDTEGAEFAATMGRISAATNGAQPPGKQADLLNQLNDKSLTQEKLMELIAAHGGGFGAG